MAVGIEADQKAFQFYGGGVLPAKKCGVKLDHGVLAVRRPPRAKIQGKGASGTLVSTRRGKG